MGIITLIVAQDALGVLGVLPGEVSPMCVNLGDKQRDKLPREGDQQDTQHPLIHSFIHLAIHKHLQGRFGPALRLARRRRARLAQLWPGDNLPVLERHLAATGTTHLKCSTGTLQEASSQ
jgi:hypothetical protein